MIHMPSAVARGYPGVWGRSPQREGSWSWSTF